jgi:hypothetical protein
MKKKALREAAKLTGGVNFQFIMGFYLLRRLSCPEDHLGHPERSEGSRPCARAKLRSSQISHHEQRIDIAMRIGISPKHLMLEA